MEPENQNGSAAPPPEPGGTVDVALARECDRWQAQARALAQALGETPEDGEPFIDPHGGLTERARAFAAERQLSEEAKRLRQRFRVLEQRAAERDKPKTESPPAKGKEPEEDPGAMLAGLTARAERVARENVLWRTLASVPTLDPSLAHMVLAAAVEFDGDGKATIAVDGASPVPLTPETARLALPKVLLPSKGAGGSGGRPPGEPGDALAPNASLLQKAVGSQSAFEKDPRAAHAALSDLLGRTR